MGMVVKIREILVVAIVAIHALAKDMETKKLHHLRKNDFSGIHD